MHYRIYLNDVSYWYTLSLTFFLEILLWLLPDCLGRIYLQDDVSWDESVEEQRWSFLKGKIWDSGSLLGLFSLLESFPLISCAGFSSIQKFKYLIKEALTDNFFFFWPNDFYFKFDSTQPLKPYLPLWSSFPIFWANLLSFFLAIFHISIFSWIHCFCFG